MWGSNETSRIPELFAADSRSPRRLRHLDRLSYRDGVDAPVILEPIPVAFLELGELPARPHSSDRAAFNRTKRKGHVRHDLFEPLVLAIAPSQLADRYVDNYTNA